jgi:hypothetical protein
VKGYYVDMRRGEKFALLAGPFASEELARKYERPAVRLALELDSRAAFDPFGVMSLDLAKLPKRERKLPRGKLNDRLEIDPADLMEGASN